MLLGASGKDRVDHQTLRALFGLLAYAVRPALTKALQRRGKLETGNPMHGRCTHVCECVDVKDTEDGKILCSYTPRDKPVFMEIMFNKEHVPGSPVVVTPYEGFNDSSSELTIIA